MATIEKLETNPYYYNHTVSSENQDSNNIYTELYTVPSDAGNDYTDMDQNNRDNADNLNIPPTKCDAHTKDIISFNRSKFYIAVAVAVAAVLTVSICAGVLGYYIRKCEHTTSEFQHQRDESRPTSTEDHFITSVTDITSFGRYITAPARSTQPTTTTISTTAMTIDEATGM